MAGTSQKKRRRLRADERREEILRAAMAVFAERGYHGASMADIAGAAGITAAVIYDHFGSKADLQIELLERETDALLMFVGEALMTAPEVPAERMRVGMNAFFEFVERDPYAWRMLFRDPPTDPAILETYRNIHKRATDGIAIFIKTGAPDVLLGDPNADRDAEMFAEMVKMAQNGIATWWYEHRDVPREVVVDRMIEFCWIGLDRVSRGERVAPDA